MPEYTMMPEPSADWVTAAIRAALPAGPGWHVSFRIARESGHKPADAADIQDYVWKIWNDSFDASGAGPGLTYYEAHLDGRGNLVLAYGNTDVGITSPLNTPQWALLLRLTHLESLLARVMADIGRYPPNKYGYS